MQNPSYIDLLLTNNSYIFQQTTTVCSRLSVGPKLVLVVLKRSIPKSIPRQITCKYCRSYLGKVYFKKRTENLLRVFKKLKYFCSRPYNKGKIFFFKRLSSLFVKFDWELKL